MPPSDPHARTVLHRFRAMGSPCEVLLEGPAASLDAAQCAVREVQRIEARYSRYQAGSVLSRINAAAGTGEVTLVDEETAALLDFAAALHASSGGLFDITSGVLRRAWDFRADLLPSQRELDALLPLIGWQQVRWRDGGVSLPRAGMELDFGGFGKEYAATRTLATSGDYERFIERDGTRYCHILDPRSGWPCRGWQSVSVVAPACVAAGALTTVAMLMGPSAPDFLRSLHGGGRGRSGAGGAGRGCRPAPLRRRAASARRAEGQVPGLAAHAVVPRATAGGMVQCMPALAPQQPGVVAAAVVGGVVDDGVGEVAAEHAAGEGAGPPGPTQPPGRQENGHQEQRRAQYRGRTHQGHGPAMVFSMPVLERRDPVQHKAVQQVFRQCPAQQAGHGQRQQLAAQGRRRLGGHADRERGRGQAVQREVDPIGDRAVFHRKELHAVPPAGQRAAWKSGAEPARPSD